MSEPALGRICLITKSECLTGPVGLFRLHTRVCTLEFALLSSCRSSYWNFTTVALCVRFNVCCRQLNTIEQRESMEAKSNTANTYQLCIRIHNATTVSLLASLPCSHLNLIYFAHCECQCEHEGEKLIYISCVCVCLLSPRNEGPLSGIIGPMPHWTINPQSTSRNCAYYLWSGPLIPVLHLHVDARSQLGAILFTERVGQDMAKYISNLYNRTEPVCC